MRRLTILIAPALLAFAASTGAADRVAAPAVPAAMQLFERDWVLMNWALKFYDRDKDILLQPEEASAAAQAFRDMADGNGDGRVTPDEFRAARTFIMARY